VAVDKNRKTIFVTLVFLSYFYCFGQSYLVHRYSETEGLPSSTVYDVIQDRQGRMWFATRAGIAVYDGLTWEKFTTAHGLPEPSIFKIRLDKKNRVWALSQAPACVIPVAYYNPAPANEKEENNYRHPWKSIQSKTIPGCTSLNITSFELVEMEQNPIIAVGTGKYGLFLWNRGNLGKWENISEQNGLLSNSINDMAFFKEKLYLATDNGLSLITINSHTTDKPIIDNRLSQSLGFPAKAIEGLGIETKDKYADSDLKRSRVWLFGHEWLGYFEAGEDRLKMTAVYPVEILFKHKKMAAHVLPDYRCGLYVGNHYELNYFNYRTLSWEQLNMVNGLIGSGANDMSIDFEKNIWIAGDRGISKISSRRFSNFQKIHGLFEDEVSAVLEVAPGKFILGHNNGITFYNSNRMGFQTIPLSRERSASDSLCRVLDMQRDSKKNTWLAASWAGLAKVTPQGSVTWYGEKDGLPRYISCLWLDEQDHVWVGGEEKVFCSTGTGFMPQKIGDFSIVKPRRIYGDRENLRYIASSGKGLYVYQEHSNQWRNYKLTGKDYQRADSIFALKRDSKGRLLLGTLAGIYILEDETLKKFKDNQFQVDRPVYFILEDNKHRLWFGTDNGVVRWDGEKEKRYSIAEGLIGQETNRAAAIQDAGGRIWIGTNRGLSIYEEAFENNELFNPAPKIYLQKIEIQGKDERIPIPVKKNQGKPLRLSHHENTIVFHFRGISFEDETAVQFKSKLEGFDKEWSEEHYPHNQMTRYINLPSGVYRFHLQAGNARGVWSDEIISPGIIILKPYYKRWWFYLCGFLLAGFIFYSIFRFFSARRYAAQLEKEVASRTAQLRAAEQRLRQAQKMEAIGTLAGGIAHDFNNILGVVLGYTELMLDEIPKETSLYRNAEQIRTAAQRAADLVKQILAFSRKSKGKQKPTKLAAVINEALKLLRSTLPATIEIRQDIRVGPDSDTILADAIQVHQVIMNLGTNAAHAMKKEGGLLTVSLDKVYMDTEDLVSNKELEPGLYLRLTVRDTGHGIPEDLQERIFDPFFTTKEPGEGTGMGLAVIHGIIKNHRGDITVYSKPGKGSTFHIYLPRVKAEEEIESQSTGEVPGGTERILLVDDEAALARAEKQILERLGYEVVGKSNSIKALELFRKKPDHFDLIISDVTMPRLTGIQLAVQAKHIRPGVPIILCSGFSTIITKEEIRAIGVNDFILKPIIKTELARIVRKVLDERKD
jgi:signal transduction histidine kinase/ligand-binding sensor domain-containing protein/CheY-like chemotaxis protein